MRERTHYTLFGYTVYELMRSRGIERQEDLAECLSEVSGETYKQQRLSRYLMGNRPAYKRLPKHLSDALELDEEERTRLAKAYAYGQEIDAVNVALSGSASSS